MRQAWKPMSTDGPVTSDRTTELAEVVADLLVDRSMVLAVTESCTAGAVTSALAAGGSAERWLRAGLVAYQEPVKRGLLGVRTSSLVTREAAAEMAGGAARLFDTQVALATTGVFGTEPVDGVEPTTVVIATLVVDGIRTARHRLDDDPEVASGQAVELALTQLAEHLRTER